MKENRDPEKLIKGAEELGISLDDKKVEQFLLFHEMLFATNRVMNLTAITEWEEVVRLHYLDSLSFVKVCKPGSKTLLDLGTGAGFPGIPLKIAFPELSVTLVDSLEKRVGFLRDAAKKLGLSDLRILHARAEELGCEEGHRETYDFVVSRAVAGLNVLSEYCIPFVKIGGMFVSYKGEDINEEAAGADQAIRTLGGRLDEIVPYEKHTLVVISKEKPTPLKYPRRAGVPKKKPL